MRANARSAYEPAAGLDGLGGAVDLLGDSSAATTMRGPGEQASANSAPIGHARALLIYLKHRGVLNVDEYRRTNARGL